MDRDEMVLRAGYYAGLAWKVLHDCTYAERWLGRVGELTEAAYLSERAEIQSRLVAAGFIEPDEDPYETEPYAPRR